MKPGDLVSPLPDQRGRETNVTLWKDPGGSGIVGQLKSGKVGIIIARYIDMRLVDTSSESLGDQCLVLAGDQLGWNETRLFELENHEPPPIRGQRSRATGAK